MARGYSSGDAQRSHTTRFEGFLREPDRPLKEVLFENYLRGAAEWLLGKPGDAYLLPQLGNSNWECSLAILFLLRMHDKLDDDDKLRPIIESKILNTARWIPSQARSEGRNQAHWEGVTWDTAVCIRAVLAAVIRFGDRFTDREQRDIFTLTENGLRWLVSRFEHWHRDVIYPFGPADIAQILLTLTYVNEVMPELGERATNSGNLGSFTEAIERIARYLIAAAEEVPTKISSAEEVTIFWGDFFSSAEVIDCLATYMMACEQGRLGSSDPELPGICCTTIIKCIRYMEANQFDGRWGAHADTCVALYAYIRATNAVPYVGQEHHVVFKALRWMCDEKQRFDDGSFMHTTFITVFYAMALLEVYEHWDVARLPTSHVYDLALWSAPVRATPERGLRLELQVKTQRLETENQAFRDSRRQRRVVLAAAAGVLGVWLSMALLASLVDVWELVDLGFSLKVEDERVFIPYVAFSFALSVTLAGVITKLIKNQ